MSSKNPWRYRCPEGHSSWVRRGDGYHCETCANYGGDSVRFNELVDMKRQDIQY